MKIFVPLFVALLLGLPAFSQPPQVEPPSSPPVSPLSGTEGAVPVGEPTDIGAVYRLVATGFQPLEMQWAAHEGRSGLFAPLQSVLVLRGGRASVRFRPSDALEFVVRSPLPVLDPNGPDPQEFILFRLRGNDRERLLLLDEAGTFDRKGPEGVHVRVQPFGPFSYKLIAPQPLPAGEYAFKYGVGLRNQNVYAFGIDDPNSDKP